jgi:hypothetical protein
MARRVTAWQVAAGQGTSRPGIARPGKSRQGFFDARPAFPPGKVSMNRMHIQPTLEPLESRLTPANAVPNTDFLLIVEARTAAIVEHTDQHLRAIGFPVQPVGNDQLPPPEKIVPALAYLDDSAALTGLENASATLAQRIGQLTTRRDEQMARFVALGADPNSTYEQTEVIRLALHRTKVTIRILTAEQTAVSALIAQGTSGSLARTRDLVAGMEATLRDTEIQRSAWRDASAKARQLGTPTRRLDLLAFEWADRAAARAQGLLILRSALLVQGIETR